MGWAIMIALAVAAGLALWRFAKLPRAVMELSAAALLLGIAGYAWQGNPSMPGAPKAAPVDVGASTKSIEQLPEFKLVGVGGGADILAAADGLIERGMDNYAIGIIKAGLARAPNNADLWVGLGNALVVHADGMISPAAQLAFERAAKLAPEHPGPQFFMGLAYAQAGQIDQAEATWRALLERSPPDAPWRADLEARLGQIAAQGGGTLAPPPAPGAIEAPGGSSRPTG